MSDSIKHECGIALIRLLKPLSYYKAKYGTSFYGQKKLYLLMEKQHNRGQDGAGVVNISLNVPAGVDYINRQRSNAKQPLPDIFEKINEPLNQLTASQRHHIDDVDWLQNNIPFTGELWLGHLRYGTFGKNSINNCHPFIRQNSWKSRTLALAGNFNMTNVDEMIQQLVSLGQHPREQADTVTVLENIGHFLDEEVELLFKRFKQEEYSNEEISELIANNLDLQRVLKRASKYWDGGYTLCGLVGHGDAFVLRDPSGIRPAYYYHDDEVVVVASERPAMLTAFNMAFEDIRELQPGYALIIKKNGRVSEQICREPLERQSCSFERIYFSRGSDPAIYNERKELGRRLCPSILESINYDLRNSVFSFIPNTAEVAFYGMIKGMEDYLAAVKVRKIKALPDLNDTEKIKDIISIRPRIEKIAIKDVKMRTFITDDAHRDDMVAHVYDVTYGAVAKGVDNLVVIDDSIVRGTTLKKSILRILSRLQPKKIVVVSSAPQIRYPDCYGIDMAKLGDFIAFNAAISLLEENNLEHIMDEVLQLCMQQMTKPKEEMVNYVKIIYEPFTEAQLSRKIAQLLTPKEVNCEVEIIYQSVDDLHQSIPNNTGDWYFTGNYPTPGGNKVVCKAFINYMQGTNERAY
ncbi:MAG: amidophosphoribosyltransferase [Bacteroidetes bacterium]|nr:amidophosphoribosyltransferase [Bacteroidota bacterium]